MRVEGRDVWADGWREVKDEGVRGERVGRGGER